MGYEVIYYYQDKIKDGYSEEIKSFKKRIGDPYEEYPIEKLSGAILLQLARRDIYVKNLEIFEITKKKIKFRETKNGIVLNNKKFSFNNMEEPIISFEDLEVEHEQIKTKQENKKEPSIPIKNEIENLNRVIKKMVYVPEPQQHIELLQKGIKLTPEKEYNIYKIESHPNGVNEIYTIKDDKNFQQKVSDLYFIPQSNLDQVQRNDDGLNWNGIINENLPSVR